MAELKPCPFCGSDNLKIISYNSIAGVCKMVECMVCFAQVPSRATKQEAITAWNRRTPQKKQLSFEEIKSQFKR